uniref:Uncharacterized protein n=1 Tax=Schistocephalus solidus TaxID=70667 RepID=A0A0V0J8N6_SCHSO
MNTTNSATEPVSATAAVPFEEYNSALAYGSLLPPACQIHVHHFHHCSCVQKHPEKFQSDLATLFAGLRKRSNTATADATVVATTNKNENTAFRITTQPENAYALTYNVKHLTRSQKLLSPASSIPKPSRAPVPPTLTLKHSAIFSAPTQGRMATIRHPSIVSLTLPNVITDEPMCHAPIQLPPGLLPPMNIVPHPAVCPTNHVIYAAKTRTKSPPTHRVNCLLPHNCGLPTQQHISVHFPQPQQPPSISTSTVAPSVQRISTLKLACDLSNDTQTSSRVLAEQAAFHKAGAATSISHNGILPCNLKGTAILTTPTPANLNFPVSAARASAAVDPDFSPSSGSLNLTERFLRWLHIGYNSCGSDAAQDHGTVSPTRPLYVDNRVCRHLAARHPRSTANQMDARRRCRSQPPRPSAHGGQQKPAPPARQRSPHCGLHERAAQVALETQRLPVATAALTEGMQCLKTRHVKWLPTNGIVTRLPHCRISLENSNSRDLTAACTSFSCPSDKSVRSTAELSAIASHHISASTCEDSRVGNSGRLRRWFFPSPSSSNSHHAGDKSRRKGAVEETHSSCVNDHYRGGAGGCVPLCLDRDSSLMRDTTAPPPPPPRMLLTKISATSATKQLTPASTRNVEVQTSLPLCSCQSKSEESFCSKETTVGQDRARIIDCEHAGESTCSITSCKCHSAYTTCCADGNGATGLPCSHTSCSVAFDCPCFSWVGDTQPALSPPVVDHHLLLHHYHYHHYYSHDCGLPPGYSDTTAAFSNVQKGPGATGEFLPTQDQVTTSSPSRPASPLIKLSLSWPPPTDGGGGITETTQIIEPSQPPDVHAAVSSGPPIMQSTKVLTATAPTADGSSASTPASDSAFAFQSSHEAVESTTNISCLQTAASEVSTAIKASPVECPGASCSSSGREHFELTSVSSAEKVAEQKKIDQRRAFLQNMNQLKRASSVSTSKATERPRHRT